MMSNYNLPSSLTLVLWSGLRSGFVATKTTTYPTDAGWIKFSNLNFFQHFLNFMGFTFSICFGFLDLIQVWSFLRKGYPIQSQCHSDV